MEMSVKDPEFGDRISVTYDGGRMNGVFVNDDPDFIFIKLDSGYNTGISRKKVRSITVVEKRKEKEEIPIRKPRKDGRGIAILSTGGTISSRIDYTTGGVKPSSTMDQIYSEELSRLHSIPVHYETISAILSENMTPERWIEVARKVKESLDREIGVVVFHGTDTMSYTASAVAFMLEDQTGTVVFTGSQRSPDRPSSDAYVNIEASIKFASIPSGEVGICMHTGLSDDSASLFRAVRSRKMHSSRRDAFRSLEFPPIGESSRDSPAVMTAYREAGKGNVLKDRLEHRVGMIYFNPTLSPEDIETFAEGKKCIVIMGTGLGHTADRLIPAIKGITSAGTKVVMTSQCISGTVDMNVYSTGRELLKAGVISAGNMVPEGAYVKSMFVLGNYPDGMFAEQFSTNMRGELLERNDGGNIQ